LTLRAERVLCRQLTWSRSSPSRPVNAALSSTSCCGFSSTETDNMGTSSFGGSESVMVLLAEVDRANVVLKMRKNEVCSEPQGDGYGERMLTLETGRGRVFIHRLASELRLLRPVSSCHQLIEHARLPCGGATWTRGGSTVISAPARVPWTRVPTRVVRGINSFRCCISIVISRVTTF
jgi:hypothetical protein